MFTQNMVGISNAYFFPLTVTFLKQISSGIALGIDKPVATEKEQSNEVCGARFIGTG
jgi:hypothetical protein